MGDGWVNKSAVMQDIKPEDAETESCCWFSSYAKVSSGLGKSTSRTIGNALFKRTDSDVKSTEHFRNHR